MKKIKRIAEEFIRELVPDDGPDFQMLPEMTLETIYMAGIRRGIEMSREAIEKSDPEYSDEIIVVEKLLEELEQEEHEED